MLLDQAIREARAGSQAASGTLLHAAGREALLRYLNGGRVLFYVERAADILGLIAFAHREGIKPIVAGGRGAAGGGTEHGHAGVRLSLCPPDDLPTTIRPPR